MTLNTETHEPATPAAPAIRCLDRLPVAHARRAPRWPASDGRAPGDASRTAVRRALRQPSATRPDGDPLAPGIGQEACSVGSAPPLDRAHDWFVPQDREAAGQLLHGLPLKQAFLWHMGSPLGFYRSRAPQATQAAVAGQIPHAVGLAWGLALQKKPGVVVVHFGEGATSQGDFHEAANIAGVMKAPVIFFCQNNYWAISTAHRCRRRRRVSRRKQPCNGFPGVQVDGNYLFAVYQAMRDAVARARRGEGPDAD